MSVPASIADVAARAGVSIGTVSNVLNRPQLVAAGTRERVGAAIAELGFVRNESARTLGAGASRAWGFVALDVGNPFFIDIARAAQDAAAADGFTVLLADSREDADHERSGLELFARQRVRGVLIAPLAGVADEVDRLRRVGIPCVVIDPVETDGGYCSVAVDDEEGGRIAAAHLLGIGHRRVAFVGGPPALHQVQRRLSGARAAVAEVAGATLLVVTTPHLTIRAGQQAAAEVLAADPRPTAVFAANDLVAIGLLHGFATAGCPVPGEMGVIGYDDIDLAAVSVTPLSTVRQPRAELGTRAAGLLLAEINQDGHHHEHRHEHRHIRFVPELVVRESTTAL